MSTMQPHPRAWLVLVILTVPVFMIAIDMSVLFLALPSIAADLAPTATQQLWTLHIGDLMSAAFLLTAGTLADRIGPRRFLAIGMVAYGLFSAAAAFSPDPATLIAARGLIGIAAVTVMPSAMVILRNVFAGDRAFAGAIAVVMAAFSGGTAFGPPIGGVLLDAFSWGAIFLVNVPIAMGVLAALPFLPATSGTGKGRLDLGSILLSLGAIILVIYALQETAADGPTLLLSALAVAGVALAVLFVRRQRRLAEPLLDLSLFAQRQFLVALAVLMLFLMAIGACYMQVAQYLQSVLGYSPLQAGLFLTVPATAQIFATALAPRLLRIASPAQAVAGGVAVAATGFALVLVALQLTGRPALLVLLAGETLASIGGGPVFALCYSIVLASVPVSRTGSASGVLDVAASLGNAVGLALGGSLAVIVYQFVLAGPALSGLGSMLADGALESIGRAVAIGERAGDASFLTVARDAFTSATRGVYLYAVALLAAILVLTLWGLRGVRLEPDDTDDQPGSPRAPGKGSATLTASDDDRP